LFAKAGVEFRQTRDVLEIVVDAREPLQLAEIARATGLGCFDLRSENGRN
jgi:hypothetical protein